jgi:hypothetical protein
LAHAVAGCGQAYSGRSLPFWYEAAQSHELLFACGAQPVQPVIDWTSKVGREDDG